MCGIAGEFNLADKVETENIVRMTDSLVHRGPDDGDVYCMENIGLGHRRLSIIDLSSAGRQPMWTADGSMAIVFNGEVYNFREIRGDLELKGYCFRSESDTEVVLNAIHCWGLLSALKKFIGMYAFAVWDEKNKCLSLARDRAGIKPLFYAKTETSILFASELKALYAHPAYRKQLDQKGAAQFFVLGYTLHETTVFANTYRVPSASFLKFDFTGDIQKKQYWRLEQIRRGSYKGTFQDASEALETLAESAFSYRLVSDVPVALFLSGGVDSAFLSAILKRKIGEDLLHITIGFSDSRYDEAPTASRIASELGVRHETRYLETPDAEDALRKFAEIYDEPFGDASGIPTALVSKVAREYVKVALSADGGDEMFCGYESYPLYSGMFRKVRSLPLFVRKLIFRFISFLPYQKILSIINHFQGSARKNPRLISTFEKALEMLLADTPSAVLRIMNEKGWTTKRVRQLFPEMVFDIFADTILANRLLGYSIDKSADMFDVMMRSDYQSFLRDDILTKVDRASMAVSLECRDPFLDHRLAEFAYSLPIEYVYDNGEHKHILKHILRKWISEDVLALPKRGFSIPLYEWMKGPWKPLVQQYLSRESIRKIGVLDDDIVSKEVQQFYRYNGIGAERLQFLLNFQMWAERWYVS